MKLNSCSSLPTPGPRLILALDVDTIEKAKYFINKLYPKIKLFKIGPVLFTAYGPKLIGLFHNKGTEVFLDLKFYDIPNTVAAAVRQAVRLKVKMLTLHISGGEEMLKAAVKAADEESARLRTKRPLLIGVTILTSQKARQQDVLKLAKTGIACGLDGVVCSAQEALLLRKNIRKKFVIVTPGIRPASVSLGDQKRAVTPRQALESGSDYLVVGRPVLNAADPGKVAEEILGELQ